MKGGGKRRRCATLYAAKSYYPLGIPMLLNPIGIVALTVFSAEAQQIVDLAVLLGMLLAVVFIVAPVPLADQFFGLKPLQQPVDYAIVGLAVLAWTLGTSFLWRVAPVERLWRRFRG